MLVQVRNERRAAGSDGVGIARISSTLLDDIAARVFEVGRTKTAQLIERCEVPEAKLNDIVEKEPH